MVNLTGTPDRFWSENQSIETPLLVVEARFWWLNTNLSSFLSVKWCHTSLSFFYQQVCWLSPVKSHAKTHVFIIFGWFSFFSPFLDDLPFFGWLNPNFFPYFPEHLHILGVAGALCHLRLASAGRGVRGKRHTAAAAARDGGAADGRGTARWVFPMTKLWFCGCEILHQLNPVDGKNPMIW